MIINNEISLVGEFHDHSEFSVVAQCVLLEHCCYHGQELLLVVAGLRCPVLVAGLVVVEVVDMAPVCCRTHLCCQALVAGSAVVEVVGVAPECCGTHLPVVPHRMN